MARNTLKYQDRRALETWLAANAVLLRAEDLTYAQIAATATKELDIEVTAGNVLGICEASKLSLVADRRRRPRETKKHRKDGLRQSDVDEAKAAFDLFLSRMEAKLRQSEENLTALIEGYRRDTAGLAGKIDIIYRELTGKDLPGSGPGRS